MYVTEGEYISFIENYIPHFYEIKDNELEKLLGDSKWKYEKR